MQSKSYPVSHEGCWLLRNNLSLLSLLLKMVTQFEVLSAPGVDEDSGMSPSSPLDGLMEYPMEHTEFEYFHTNLSTDSYYDTGPQPPELSDTLVAQPSSAPPTPTTPGTGGVYDATGGYDGTIMIYDHDNSPPLNNVAQFNDGFESPCDIRPSEEEIKLEEHNELGFSEDMSTYNDLSGNLYESRSISDPHAEEFSLGSLCDFEQEPHFCSKEEINFHEDISIKDEEEDELTPRFWDEGKIRPKHFVDKT